MVEISTNGNSFTVEESLTGYMEAMEELLKLDPWDFVTIKAGGDIVFANNAIKIPFDSFAESLNPFPEKELILGTRGDDVIDGVSRDDNTYVFTGPGDDQVTVDVERSGEGGGLTIDMGDGFNTLVLEQSQGVPGIVMPHYLGEPTDIMFGNQFIHVIGANLILDDSGAPILPEFPTF